MTNLVAELAVVFAVCFALGCNVGSVSAQTDDSLQVIADRALAQGHTPGIMVGIYSPDDGIQVAAAGRRKWDDETLLTVDDQMHLGSCTKAFTSVLIARLIEQEKLSWDSTLIEILPELRTAIHADYHEITVRQLTTHTSGVPYAAKNWWIRGEKNISRQRLKIVKQTLKSAPKHAVGTKYLYSNLGYMIAGLMAGRVSNQTWEEALTTEVLEPLGITTAGFGVPGETGEVVQPWGHLLRRDGEFAAMQRDNSPSLGPAGTLYLSVSDWGKLLDVFLGNAPDGFLNESSIQELMTPSNVHKYAKGWMVMKRRWGNGVVLNHAGSNTMWYANVWVAPELGQAFLVNMNCASEEAMAQADKIIGELIQESRKEK